MRRSALAIPPRVLATARMAPAAEGASPSGAPISEKAVQGLVRGLTVLAVGVGFVVWWLEQRRELARWRAARQERLRAEASSPPSSGREPPGA